jgi:glycosyltransferase involved in cell wall biosynthesis
LKYQIVQITSGHLANDIRVFYKECRSIADSNFEVILIVPHHSKTTVDNVMILPIPISMGRFVKIFINPVKLFLKTLRLSGDIYHFHDPAFLPFGLILKFMGKRVIYDIHEDVPKSIHSRDYLPKIMKDLVSCLIEKYEIFVAKRLSGLVCATPAITRRFEKINLNTMTVNNYPLQAEINYDHVSRWHERKNAVAYIGSITRVRGIFEIIRSLTYISSKYNVSLELAGKFSSSKLFMQAHMTSGWDRVNYYGQIDRASVKNLLRNVRAGLVIYHPEPNAIEAQPNKLFEYMAEGIPVIASDFPLWRDIILENHCGLVVNPLNPEEIAEAITYIFTHPIEAEKMGINGLEAVQSTFNWEKEKTKLFSLYNKLLSEI